MVCDIDFIVITGNILHFHHLTGNIIILKIVVPGFYPIHFTITFAGQTNVDCYTGNIVIPKIIKLGFHCTREPEPNNDICITLLGLAGWR